MITVWSGREAQALRAALRMSVYDFAVHAGVAPRSVAKWAARGASMRLRWDVQRKLDRVLAGAPADVHDRLRELLAQNETPQAPVPTRGAPVPDLIATLVNPPEPAPGFVPPALIHLERAVARLRMAYQACRYQEVLHELPDLTRLLLAAQASQRVNFPARVRKLAAEVYHVATDLLLKFDDVPVAMLAATRCAQEAQASGEPLTIAAAQRATARVLIRSGHPGDAALLAGRAATQLAARTSLDGPRPLSGYGALLLRGAMAYASGGDAAQTMVLLKEAAGMAQRLGSDGNFGWTAFGPTNVAQHRVSALLALGDPAEALAVAHAIDPGRIRLPERRAAYYVDTACALRELGRSPEAVARLRQAAAIAPEELALGS